MKNLFLVLILLYSSKSFSGDSMNAGGLGEGRMVTPNRSFSDVFGVGGGTGGGGLNKPFYNRILEEALKNGVDIFDGEFGRETIIKDHQDISTFLRRDRIENRVSGGIIGRLP